MKIWERVIKTRQRRTVNISQASCQGGAPQILSLHCGKLWRSTEGKQCIVFIDLEKAYDRVPRVEVWNCLRLKGVPEGYVRLIQDMYQGCTTQIRCAAGVTRDFEVSVGVHQGSALSPLLFAIGMDCLTEEVRLEAPWNMMFVDDVVLCTETRGS